MLLPPYKKSTVTAVFLLSGRRGMDYDRRRAAAPRFEEVVHRPAEADESLGKAYLALVSFKQGIDSMEEIPKQLHALYEQVGKAMNEVAEARKHTYQLRMMMQRFRL
jgi:hypothetical protein